MDAGSWITGIALNADNTRAFTVSEDKIARLWDVEKETVLKELKDHANFIPSVALSADGSIALTGSSDGPAQVWNMNTGKLIKTIQGTSVDSVALSADGTLALTGSRDNIARLYNTSTGELKELKGHIGAIKSVALRLMVLLLLPAHGILLHEYGI